ncbi:MAG: arginine--tRNA ligase [Fibrobacterota bacterium]|nr:arginine--tRNA ligase [Chitinispirillaceae bacterium]
MKDLIVELLSGVIGDKLSRDDISKLIEIPPSDDLGDFSFPVFSLSKVFRKSPVVITEEIKAGLVLPSTVEKVVIVSGYLNFFMNKQVMAQQCITSTAAPDYGRLNKSGTVVVEFASPNTNKPLHLGHLRNMSIGESISRLLSFCGFKVVRASINNDRGVHICKSMLAYKEFGNNTTPESENKKSDHFVGDYYVAFSKKAAGDESWNERAQEMLRLWEAGDEPTVALWKVMNAWALDGFRQTYKLFGIKFDKEYYESQIYKFGKEIILEGLEKGIFTKRADGAVIVNLEDEKLGEKVLLRPDGTSVYIVQDIFLAVLKNKEYSYDRSFYVVGNEQEYHFQVLIAIFRKLGYPIADKMKHLSYGMVELPEGRMKSREGTVVDADDLVKETQTLAAEELKERYKLTDDEMNDRSLKIALSAIKYTLLRIDTLKNMMFDPKKAISFEGDTGPYLLYSYARASSIIRKSISTAPVSIGTLEASEVKLIKKLNYFTSSVNFAYEKLSPSVIANYAFELAQCFNEFYHGCKVIGSNEEPFRIQLVKAFRSVLGNCLWILGIDSIEEM